MGFDSMRKRASVGALVGLLLHASIASAMRINVDFNTSGSPTQSGAGLIGDAGDFWNGVVGSSGANDIPLVDSANAATPVTLSFVSTGAFDDANNSFSATPFADLMRDYMHARDGTTGSIGLSGLVPNTTYDLVFYSNPNQDRIRATEFILGGVSKVANSVGTATEFIEGVNYVRFKNALSSSAGELLVDYKFASGAGNLEGNVNGFQIEAAPPPTPTGLINVDFGRSGTPTQSGAGLIGSADDVWNGVVGSSSANDIPLVDSANAATSVKLSFVSTGAFDDSNNSFSATPFADLMRDYMHARDGTIGSISLSGLTPNAAYELILYSNPNQDRVRATEFIVDGISKIADSVGTATEFIEGVNYVEFSRVFADASGNLLIDFKFASGAGNLEGNVNGLQIRPTAVPEPAALMMMLVASAGLIARRRQRR